MKFLFACVLVMALGFPAIAQNICPIIPMPAHAEKANGAFMLTRNTPIVADDILQPVVYYLQKELLRLKGLSLSRQGKTTMPAIKLSLATKPVVSAESYSLVMNADGITITAPSATGVFYGVISLIQLAQQATVHGDNLSIANWKIEDAPHYGWRGFMLDESRYFFGKEKVKSLLDWMAFYKLNRFHWHLTDEPGWRLEIKQYPLLAFIGGIGNVENPDRPAEFYTQEDIKEIVAYASERHIMVIPEIDMPGHATAANRAYPQFSGGGSAAHPEFTFNPGKTGTYTYITNILREVNVLFPAQMIHVGGDEVSYGNEKWKTDSSVNRLLKENKLADMKAAELYFMKRMADSIYRLNAKLLVWDEMAEADLPPANTVVFWWRQDKPETLKMALTKGYATVLCPRLPFYFDFVQDSTHKYGRRWNKNLYASLESVYNFSPAAVNVPADKSDLILGVQANLWTETVASNDRLDYLLFPRISALAENAWSAPAQRNYPTYLKRLQLQLPLYKKAKVYYYNPFEPGQHPEPLGTKE